MQRALCRQGSIELVEIDNIPLFQQASKDEGPRKVVSELAKKTRAADGVASQLQNYDHSIPAVLQNALCLAVLHLPYGQQASHDCQLGTLDLLFSFSSVKFWTLRESKAAIMPGSSSSWPRPQAFDEKGGLKAKLPSKRPALTISVCELNENGRIARTSPQKRPRTLTGKPVGLEGTIFMKLSESSVQMRNFYNRESCTYQKHLPNSLSLKISRVITFLLFNQDLQVGRELPAPPAVQQDY